MDSGDKILMAAGVTAAVMVGAFVLWGPSGESRNYALPEEATQLPVNSSPHPSRLLPTSTKTWSDSWPAQLRSHLFPEHSPTGTGGGKQSISFFFFFSPN